MQAVYTCLTKHFATRLQLILLTQQFSGSEAISILIEINSTLVQLIQRVVAREWRRRQMSKTVNTSVWRRTVAFSRWFTLSHTINCLSSIAPLAFCNNASHKQHKQH